VPDIRQFLIVARGFLLPGAAEADGKLREEILRLGQRGLGVIAPSR
jgi:hypothetical protein